MSLIFDASAFWLYAESYWLKNIITEVFLRQLFGRPIFLTNFINEFQPMLAPCKQTDLTHLNDNAQNFELLNPNPKQLEQTQATFYKFWINMNTYRTLFRHTKHFTDLGKLNLIMVVRF